MANPSAVLPTGTNDKFAVLLGMPRAATTFLYHHLAQHPDVMVPFRRKTNYYGVHYRRSREWYLGHFDVAGAQQVCLDTDTLSFLNAASYARFRAAYAGEAVILIVRDPASWALSLYRQISSFVTQMPDFVGFVRDGYVLREDGADVPFRFAPGDLARKIDAIIEDFGDRLLLISFEQISSQPLRALQAIEAFLGIRPWCSTSPELSLKINASNRGGLRWGNAALRNPQFIAALREFLPRRMVVGLRRSFDRLSARRASDEGLSGFAAEIQMARSYYHLDACYTARLFEESDYCSEPLELRERARRARKALEKATSARQPEPL